MIRISPSRTCGALVLVSFLVCAAPVLAQHPNNPQVPIPAKSVPQFVDPLPHFAYPGARLNATTAGTPVTVEMMPHDQQALSTGTVLPNGTVVGGGAGLTHVWAYRLSNGTTTLGPLWPTHTIEAKRNVPLDVLYLNNINESYDAVNIWVDQTLHWANPYDPNPQPDPYDKEVPAVVHLHGGEVPAWSDGGPDAWYTPGGTVGGHAAMTNIYRYPNTQEAATLWFHDHALGVTRLNVYAGLAGFYFLRDDAENARHLPGWTGDGTVQEVDPVTGANFGAPYLPEIEVVIQDRMFDSNGQLFFPAGVPGGAPNPGVHPAWIPEFVGDIITVNGKTWPYLSVAPRKYRFRFLNGSNARFYELWLEDLATAVRGPVIHQIGTDGGLLDGPVAIDPNLGGKLLLGPGERADIVIDFGSVANPNPAAPNAVWTLRNSGNTPYPKGAPPNGATLGRIMQFVVNGTMVGSDNSVVTGRATPLVKLANFATGTPAVNVQKTRQLTLNEVMGPGGPLEVLVNNTKWMGNSRPYNDFTPDPSGGSGALYSEIINEGQTEVWQIINLTADAHPIHLHLVQFQLLNRQNFNVNKYLKQYDKAFVAAGFPNGFEGAWGPPLHYTTGKDPNGKKWTSFLGGNPDVNPYLQGMATPARPEERGWKDTFIMLPGEVTTVIARWGPTDVAANTNTSNVYFEFDPNGGHGYVWHCHIIDHEDNEMMRPYSVTANGNAPGGRLAAPIYDGYYEAHPAAAAFAARTAAAAKSTGTAPRTLAGELQFGLGQNAPNPFSDLSSIRFSLPEATHVKLVLYSVTGRKIATLIDREAPAGFHTVELDAASLAPGVYFYTMTAGEFSQTRKLVLSR